MKRLIREPLLHFLLLGAALFGLYAALNGYPASSKDAIVVSAGQLENLAATFAKTWQRPPTTAELRGLVEHYVKEEILSREAVKLGLDQNDTVIRRRLQQKMEFVAEDFAAASEPTDAELEDYLGKHPSDFQREPRFTFRQVFLDPESHGRQLAADSTALLAQLRTPGFDADVGTLGDQLLLPAEFHDEAQSRVTSDFGKEFSTELAKVKPGEWTGPLRSAYGVHLVFINDRTEARLPALAEVRAEVERELIAARRRTANQKLLEGLLAKYRVTIDWSREGSESQATTTAMNQ